MKWVEFKDKMIYQKSKTPLSVMATKIQGGYHVVIDDLNGKVKYIGFTEDSFNKIFK